MHEDLRAQQQKVVDDKNAAAQTGYGDASAYGITGGTLLPRRSNDLGKSPAFDVHAPIQVNVDPEYTPGLTYVAQAVRTVEPVEDELDEAELRAKMDQQAPALQDKPKAAKKARAPKAVPVKLAGPVESDIPQVSIPVPEAPKKARRAAPAVEEVEAHNVPKCRVAFNLGELAGKIECFYHRAFQDGVTLVLIWDSTYRGYSYTPNMALDRLTEVEIGESRKRLNVYIGPTYYDEEHEERVTVMFIQE